MVSSRLTATQQAGSAGEEETMATHEELPTHPRTRLVPVPADVINRAVRKARREYVRVAEEAGHDPGPADECWAEFEALAHYGTSAEEEELSAAEWEEIGRLVAPWQFEGEEPGS